MIFRAKVFLTPPDSGADAPELGTWSTDLGPLGMVPDEGVRCPAQVPFQS